MFLAASLFQPAILAISKISVLILLRRLFVLRGFRIATDLLLAIVVAWFVAIEISNATICLPIDFLRWNPDVPAHCGDETALNQASPIPWIVTDLAILVLPLPMIRKLNMPIQQKLGLGILFLVGSLYAISHVSGNLLMPIRTLIVSCLRYAQTFYSVTDATCKSTESCHECWKTLAK